VVHFLLLLRLPLGFVCEVWGVRGEVFLVPFTDSAIEEAFRGAVKRRRGVFGQNLACDTYLHVVVGCTRICKVDRWQFMK
jgi:hypothetical protein